MLPFLLLALLECVYSSTCQNACGTYIWERSCQCDYVCGNYGDCCADLNEFCTCSNGDCVDSGGGGGDGDADDSVDGFVDSGNAVDGFADSGNAASIPADWTCNDYWYNALDGCDCNCGVWDPDCDVDGQWLYGCPSQDDTCTNQGNMPVCVADASIPAVPTPDSTSNQDPYLEVNEGVTTCPSGYEQISTAAECETACDYLGTCASYNPPNEQSIYHNQGTKYGPYCWMGSNNKANWNGDGTFGPDFVSEAVTSMVCKSVSGGSVSGGGGGGGAPAGYWLCNNGCAIHLERLNDGSVCDCPDCEDENNWTCQSCGAGQTGDYDCNASGSHTLQSQCYEYNGHSYINYEYAVDCDYYNDARNVLGRMSRKKPALRTLQEIMSRKRGDRAKPDLARLAKEKYYQERKGRSAGGGSRKAQKPDFARLAKEKYYQERRVNEAL